MGHRSDTLLPRPARAIAAHIPAKRPTLLVVFVTLSLAVLLFAFPAVAQTAAQPMPENAHAKSYGEGWECDIGFRLNNTACVAVVAPENAYYTGRSYGSGWDCLRGFRKTDGPACVAVEVPEGGFLDPSGERWRCLRGYVRVDDTCQEVVLPDHAYLADATFGSAWRCERGYEATANQCTAIEVPANAYLNGSNSIHPWTCERGFFERAGLCEAVVVPDNAYFDDATYGTGWKCNRGYAATEKGCERIELPENAHLDTSGNRWACNKNFQKSKGRCVLSN